jgi:hypothetical protein
VKEELVVFFFAAFFYLAIYSFHINFKNITKKKISMMLKKSFVEPWKNKKYLSAIIITFLMFFVAGNLLILTVLLNAYLGFILVFILFLYYMSLIRYYIKDIK